ESVGSCTDLIATVVNPLMHFHPSLEIVVSVFADACNLHQRIVQQEVLFDEEVEYIFMNQLQEADLLVVNKIDLLAAGQIENLKKHLTQLFPHKTILFQNSLEKESISVWVSSLQQFQLTQKRQTLQINYDTYAEGEAKLGWLDEELEILTPNRTAVAAATSLIKKIHDAITSAGYPIGHLKFLLNDGVQKRKLSFVALHQSVQNLFPSHSNAGRCILLVNARVQTDPATLKALVASAIKEVKEQRHCKIIERKLLAFKPGYPKPQHRMVHS
ncbi:MAG TPA: GTP-binding protein, partial [Flavisolibacter sp.]